MIQTPTPLRVPETFFIGGQWVKPRTDRTIEVISPVTEERLMTYPEAGEPDIDDAVKAARAAFETGPWPRTSPAERAAVLRRTADELEKRTETIARDWMFEIGAPIGIGSLLAQHNAQIFRHYADLLDEGRVNFAEERSRLDGGRSLVLREPVGVCATITPWNAAMVLMSYKVAAGLAAGCTFVSKPSPETPLEGYVLAECLEAAGLPEGVFNLVPAGAAIGEYLARHPGIDKVAFTGSTAAGKKVAAICAQRVARVSLELGGKSASILLDDTDFNTAVQSIAFFSMPNAGQVCLARTRILVPRSRADEFTELFVKVVSQFTIGDPSDPQVFMGPVSKVAQYERILDYIAIGIREGARLVLGGGRPAHLDKGFFIEPTVFADVTPEMTIAREEIFGPVVVIMPYEDEDDAVRIANDSTYGLSGSVFSADTDRALRVARRIRTGDLSINGNVLDPTMPIGGFKQSGIGREGGIEGLNNYLEVKTINFA